jgi:predicted nucleotidyltransferase
MADSALNEAERKFLDGLNARGVRFLVVGMSAALLQGARGATDDIDLWFERLDDPGIQEAARAAGGFWVSGSFGMRPPALGGEQLSQRFDVVTHVHGVDSFDVEAADAVAVELEGVPLKLLPLHRILASKRATGRPKDLAQLHALEEALAVAAELAAESECDPSSRE